MCLLLLSFPKHSDLCEFILTCLRGRGRHLSPGVDVDDLNPFGQCYHLADGFTEERVIPPNQRKVVFSSGEVNCWNFLGKDSLFFTRWTIPSVFFLWIVIGLTVMPGMPPSWGWKWSPYRGSQGWERDAEWILTAVPVDWLPRLCIT